MAYCRWSDGDVYLYGSGHREVTCYSCALAPLVPTIFTKGVTDSIFGKVRRCRKCKGSFVDPLDGGPCRACGWPGSIYLTTKKQIRDHEKAHRKAGHEFPRDAFKRAIEEFGTDWEAI